MTADVLDRLGEIDQADVVRCARMLLRSPLLRAGGPDADLLPLVHRHRATLTDLFAGVLGYRLVVERRFARLYKSGAGADPTRGEPTLGPRGYAYLALAMAALTTAGRQTLLSRLVIDIRAAAAQAGIEVTDDLGDLRALAAALRHLVSLGVSPRPRARSPRRRPCSPWTRRCSASSSPVRSAPRAPRPS